MIGMPGLDSFSRCCSSSPLMPGRSTSRMRQAESRDPLRSEEFLSRIEDLNVVSGRSEDPRQHSTHRVVVINHGDQTFCHSDSPFDTFVNLPESRRRSNQVARADSLLTELSIE